MPDDRRLTISSTGRLHPDEIARRTFGTARRGFEVAEVRGFLEQVARDMAAMEERERDLRDLLTDAQRRAENPVLDESTLTAALGQETVKVLRSAQEAAGDLVAHAEDDATRMLTEAHEEAETVRSRAEQNASERTLQSEAAANETRRRAQEEAIARVETARSEAEALMEQVRSECRSMLTEAQELRAKVLSDLSRRRRVLHSQIEQLRAGRDRLAETIGGVRQDVDRITEELFRAEDEARIAAEAAGRQLAVQPEITEQAATMPETVLESGEPPTGTAAELRRELAVPEPGEEAVVTTPVAPEEIGVVDLEEVETPRPGRTVEELFARLRAEQEQAADIEAEPTSELETEMLAGESAEKDKDEGSVVRVLDEAAAASGPEAVQSPDSVSDSVSVSEDTKIGEGEGGPVTEPLLSQRDEVLGPIVATLARRLKRALSDDQNDILDRLRAGKTSRKDLLPSEENHRERYADAASEQLAEAASAGASFAGGKPDDAPSVADIAQSLAAAIVAPLRRRLLGDENTLPDADEAFAVEQVGAAYRDWKGARVERLAGDEATSAFGRAALAATEPDSPLRWIVDDDGADCPDCDDNALAGPLPKGEAFPTGHPHPPAHAGCRCLLVSAEA